APQGHSAARPQRRASMAPRGDSAAQPRQCDAVVVLRAVAELIAGSGKLIRLCRWPGGPASAGQAGQGLGGEVPGGQGPEQVVYGAGESPFGGSLVLAAHAQLAEAHVVLDVAVRGLGDVAALAVGRDRVPGP